MTALWNPISDVDDWSPRLARMERLGASAQELAKEQLEELLGFDGKGGHKAPRQDIQKMKEVYDLFNKGHQTQTQFEDAQKRQEWEDRYELTQHEENLYKVWTQLNGMKSGDPFAGLAGMLESSRTPEEHNQHIRDGGDLSPEAKKAAGALLKKAEERYRAQLYQGIKNALEDMYRTEPESYKMWPWAVKQMKAEFQNQFMHGAISAPGRGAIRFNHIKDIVGEGGRVLNQLRQENKIPNNFDVNQLDFKQFEEWLMEWKRENRESNSQGEVVYQFHDDWTIQKLTTADQLQYEGDEMGHCVGGYSQPVGDGEIIIYSLRDPKGKPHVTMEVYAQKGTRDDPSDTRAAQYVNEYIHPDEHEPGQHDLDNGVDENNHSLKSGKTPFQIVQVQGNGNTTPKPEYQRKIREFLDALRAKGWTFEKSDDWYAPHDEGGGGGGRYGEYDEYGRGIENASQLDDWWNHYRENTNTYQGKHEDAYGLKQERAPIPVGDYGEVLLECCASLVDDYDRDRWKTSNYASLAQAVYHAWCLDTYQNDQSKNKLEVSKGDLEAKINKAQEKVDEWTSDSFYYAAPPDTILEKFEELAQKQGVEIDEFENIHDAEAAHPELYEEAEIALRDEFEEEYSGNAYKFLGYLYNLLHHNGVVNPGDLPDPNQTHGGLPSYDELTKRNEEQWQQRQEQPLEMPGALSSWNRIANDIQIHPIDQVHNDWFDEDGEQHARWRPGWAKDPETGKMRQTGELQDTFLDKQGRQGEGWVAYHGDRPIGSLTYVDTPVSNMIGTAFVHPDYREQGIFNRLAEPLRSNDKPTDAYVWNNPWLKSKVRGWQR